FEIVGIWNLATNPRTTVVGIVNKWSTPFALVLWVFLRRTAPGTTARGFLTKRILNFVRDPFTILFVVPIGWLLTFGIVNVLFGIFKPIIGLDSLEVWNVHGSILIPVRWLDGIGIDYLCLIDPVNRL